MRPYHTWFLFFCGLTSILVAFAPAQDKRLQTSSVRPAVQPDSRGVAVRRPLPPSDIYDIKREAETIDSQGTAFAIDRSGVWATAGHATLGCVRVTLGYGKHESLPAPSVLQGMDSDISLILGEEGTYAGIPLSDHTPLPGTAGYHMGFPSNMPTVVGSTLIGSAGARTRDGSVEPLLVWSEGWRSPDSSGSLGGISGGPVLDDSGRVVGLVSMVTDRRGRVITVTPEALQRMVRSSNALPDRGVPLSIKSPDAAIARFRKYVSEGLIRKAYCAV